jgi:hypothetical protein
LSIVQSVAKQIETQKDAEAFAVDALVSIVKETTFSSLQAECKAGPPHGDGSADQRLDALAQLRFRDGRRSRPEGLCHAQPRQESA